MSIIRTHNDSYHIEFDREDIEELLKNHVIQMLSLEEGTDLERIKVAWPSKYFDVLVTAVYDE